MTVGVIIVAGGRGARLGGDVPKQLLDLGGQSILQRSVMAFDHLANLAALVVVLPPDLVAAGHDLVGPTRRHCQFASGGARRQDSVRRGLEALPEDLDVVLVHDAARPFVDPALIDRVIEAAVRTGAAVPAVQAKDTVKRVRAGEVMVAATIAREEIWLAQTPQGFRRSVIVAATALGETGIDATDEAMLAERAGYQVEVVAGDDANVKITTKDDLETARRAIAGVPRVGTGYDLHRLVEGRPLVLAGVTIPSERGPLGHSDGDVVCHAVVDAMFGAAGVGDIGQHFPDSDPRWRGAAGLDLLGRAARIVAEAGWRATNVDVTVVLERPKLAPHVASIRACVADVLELEVSQVSVKGKTNETVDAVGRSEAIASHAVVCLAARRAAG